MDFLAIIPARSGSKGVKNKNKKELNNKPLIEYTIESSIKSKLVSKTFVSTDDNEIIDLTKKYNKCNFIKRPKHLSLDNTPSADVVVHVLHHLKEKNNYFPDAIILLQPTSPFRNSIHIDEAIKMYQSEPMSKSLVSVTKVPHNMIPESIMKKDSNNQLTHYKNSDTLRRQDKPFYYARNGAAIYIVKTNFFLKEQKFFDNGSIGYEMNYFDSIDIDNHEDWLLAEILMKHKTL